MFHFAGGGGWGGPLALTRKMPIVLLGQLVSTLSPIFIKKMHVVTFFGEGGEGVLLHKLGLRSYEIAAYFLISFHDL